MFFSITASSGDDEEFTQLEMWGIEEHIEIQARDPDIYVLWPLGLMKQFQRCIREDMTKAMLLTTTKNGACTHPIDVGKMFKFMKMLIPCNSDYSNYLVKYLCPVCLKVINPDGKTSTKVTNHTQSHHKGPGAIWHQRSNYLDKWSKQRDGNKSDEKKYLYMKHVALKQQQHLLTEGWRYIYGFKTGVVSPNQMLDKLIELLKTINIRERYNAYLPDFL